MKKHKVTILNTSAIDEPDCIWARGIDVQGYLSQQYGGPITHACVSCYDDAFDPDSKHAHVIPIKRILYEVSSATPKKRAGWCRSTFI